ncbi:MAG: PaaI family thioesterase [Pseudomonadota bacterium]
MTRPTTGPNRGERLPPELDPRTIDVPDGFEPITSSNEFGLRNGPLFERTTDRSWVRGFRAASHHCNRADIVHGGMLMTFADILCARALLDHADPPFVTIRLVTDFLGAAPKGCWVEGQAKLMGIVEGVAQIEARIAIGHRPVMTAQGTFRLLRAH